MSSVQVPGVHLVEARRAVGEAGLHEAALGVLALGARDDPAVLGTEDVVAGRDVVVVRVLTAQRDHHVVRVFAALADATLQACGVLEAELVAAAAVVIMPGAVADAVVWMESDDGHRARVRQPDQAAPQADPARWEGGAGHKTVRTHRVW